MSVPVGYTPITYPGPGGVVFSFPWRILDAGDISVYKDNVLLVLDVDYTVKGVGDYTGGSITLTVDLGGSVLVLARNAPISQITKPADPVIELGLDRLAMGLQQTSSQLTAMLIGDASISDLIIAMNAALRSAGVSGLMTYTAPFSGAVTRTLSDKALESLTVADFGAVGDGSVDDTVALQAAITAAAGRSLQFTPDADYLISAPLVPHPGSTYVGNGCRIKVKDGTDFSYQGMFNGPCDDVHITDFVLDGNKSVAGTKAFGVKLTGGSRNWVTKCLIHDTYYSGMWIEGQEYLTVMSNEFLDNGVVGISDNHGIEIVSLSGSSVNKHLNISNNFLKGIARKGIATYQRDGGSNSDIIVDTNTLENIGLGGIFLGSLPEQGVSSGNVASNNIIRGCYTSIELNSLSDFSCTGNVITNTTDRNGISLFDCVDGAVTGNQMSDSNFRGMLIASSLSGSANWLTSTSYAVGNGVTQGSATYVCLVDHTSGTFATDLAAGKWRLLQCKNVSVVGNTVTRSNRVNGAFQGGIDIIDTVGCLFEDNVVADEDVSPRQIRAFSEGANCDYNIIRNNSFRNAVSSLASISGANTLLETSAGRSITTNAIVLSPEVALVLANGANNNVALTDGTRSYTVSGPTADFNITGLVAGTDGQEIELWNSVAFNMTITQNSTSSSVGNRIRVAGDRDVKIAAHGSVSLRYSTAASMWVVTAFRSLPNMDTPESTLALSNGDNNDVAVTSVFDYYLIAGPSAAYAITGLTAGLSGQRVTLINNVAFPLTIKYNNGGSSAGNKILAASGQDIVLNQYGSARLVYSPAKTSWIVEAVRSGTISTLQVSGGGFTANGATTTFTFPANQSYHYITTSAASLATTLPATSAVTDGLVISFCASAAVATATWVAGSGGATIVGAPAALVANTPVRFRYHHATTSWYPA